MKLMDFIRGEKTEPICFCVNPKRINSVYRYEAEIYEKKSNDPNVKVGRVTADTQLVLKIAVWFKCHAYRKKLREEAKSDPKPWKVKL